MNMESRRSGLGPNRWLGLSHRSPVSGAARSGGPRRAIALVVAGCLLAGSASLVAPSAAFAGTHTKAVSKESGMGAAAAVSSIFYSPVKLVYAAGGLLIGSLAWVFTAGDTDVADKIFVRSVRGTYVITPEILRGEEPLVFIGRDPSVMPVEEPKAVASGPVAEAPAEDAYTDDAYGDSGW